MSVRIVSVRKVFKFKEVVEPFGLKQGHQNKCESGEGQKMDIELHWQLLKAA